MNSEQRQQRRSSALWTTLAVLVLGPTGAWASVPVSGTLKAARNCEAFVSKRSKSNPDKVHLEPGDAYPLLEANRPDQPDWYRVQVEDASPPQRWVEATCGTVVQPEAPPAGEVLPSEPTPIRPDNASLCSTAGLQDSYVLALSWQPAFCESHRNKKECALNFDASYQKAGNFTLHGLWPNRDACGTNYGNCEHQRDQRDFCAFPTVEVSPVTAKQLGQVMPGTASCLERHEWWKHGTCQTDWDASQYFEVAMDLVRQFNDSGMRKYMADNMGKTVRRDDFLKQVDSALGAGSSDRLQLLCAGGKLTDVYLSLPAHILPGSKLSELIMTSQPDSHSNCPANLVIDAVGF
ncbi:MAG: ribonuclease T2 family protein [Hyalangium sp.]|uniref:ribonuclease T2 family protein n=1 Tax=Hyalangium sp. TaxID=2028555 RepID=UPI00389A596C